MKWFSRPSDLIASVAAINCEFPVVVLGTRQEGCVAVFAGKKVEFVSGHPCKIAGEGRVSSVKFDEQHFEQQLRSSEQTGSKTG
jgi:hypothetical protein